MEEKKGKTELSYDSLIHCDVILIISYSPSWFD